MTATILQIAAYSGGNTNVTSAQQAFANPMTAGSAIACWVSWSTANNPGATVSVADPTNGSYTPIGPTLIDPAATQTLEGFYIGNIASSAAVTVTMTLTASNRYPSILLVEIGGVDAAAIAGPAAFNGQVQSPGPSTTDGLSSGDIVIPGTVTQALLLGASLDNFIAAPAAGTGFNNEGTYWNFDGTSGSGAYLRLESLLVPSGTFATLFSGAPGNGSMTFGMAFKEPGSGPSIVKSPLSFSGPGLM